MEYRNRFFDDMGKLMNNAFGVAQGAKTEAETAFKSYIERWMAEQNFVLREEFEAIKTAAFKAREENAALEKRIATLEAMLKEKPPESPTSTTTRKAAPKKQPKA